MTGWRLGNEPIFTDLVFLHPSQFRNKSGEWVFPSHGGWVWFKDIIDEKPNAHETNGGEDELQPRGLNCESGGRDVWAPHGKDLSLLMKLEQEALGQQKMRQGWHLRYHRNCASPADPAIL